MSKKRKASVSHNCAALSSDKKKWPSYNDDDQHDDSNNDTGKKFASGSLNSPTSSIIAAKSHHGGISSCYSDNINNNGSSISVVATKKNPPPAVASLSSSYYHESSSDIDEEIDVSMATAAAAASSSTQQRRRSMMDDNGYGLGLAYGTKKKVPCTTSAVATLSSPSIAAAAADALTSKAPPLTHSSTAAILATYDESSCNDDNLSPSPSDDNLSPSDPSDDDDLEEEDAYLNAVRNGPDGMFESLFDPEVSARYCAAAMNLRRENQTRCVGGGGGEARSPHSSMGGGSLRCLGGFPPLTGMVNGKIKSLPPSHHRHHHDESDDDYILKRRVRRRHGDISKNILRIITINVCHDWPGVGPAVCRDEAVSTTAAAAAAAASSCATLAARGVVDSKMNDDLEIAKAELYMASGAVASIVREMGVAILEGRVRERNNDGEGEGSLKKEEKVCCSSMKKKGKIVDSIQDSHKENCQPPQKKGHTKIEPNIPTITPTPSKPTHKGTTLFSPELLSQMSEKAKQIEKEVCDRLDQKGLQWRASGKIGPVQSTLVSSSHSSSSTPKAYPDPSFSFYEVASRGPGRLDVRYGMDQPPFNNPNVTHNPIILPIVEHLLGVPQDMGGTAAAGSNIKPTLVYAGLIFSFPHSTDQTWHMDGATLFPECKAWLDLPTYALNIFIPLDDITDELGPTEFIPESHLSSKACEVDENLMKLYSKQIPEEEWLDDNFIISPLLKRGDALIYDYRVCHRGTKNLSDETTRYMLYLMYARPWFKEHLNFGDEKLFS